LRTETAIGFRASREH